MTDPNSEPAASVSDRFLAMVTSRRRDPRRPPVENEDFLLMMFRMIRAVEVRAIEDPAILVQVIALGQRLDEVVNVAIAMNADRFRIDPRRGASQGECAALLGIKKQSASERAVRGRAIVDDRLAAAGAAKFSEAAREREAINAASAHADEHLVTYRARHLRVVA